MLTERPSQPTNALQARGDDRDGPAQGGLRVAAPARAWPADSSGTRSATRQGDPADQVGAGRARAVHRDRAPRQSLPAGPQLERSTCPGLGVVPLAGLTVLQATQRLAIEPFLRDFRIRADAVAARAGRYGRPQALRLRPLRRRADHVRAGDGHSGALGVRGRAWRSARGAADRQHQGQVIRSS